MNIFVVFCVIKMNVLGASFESGLQSAAVQHGTEGRIVCVCLVTRMKPLILTIT